MRFTELYEIPKIPASALGFANNGFTTTCSGSVTVFSFDGKSYNFVLGIYLTSFFSLIPKNSFGVTPKYSHNFITVFVSGFSVRS